jgi:hypothetical protein
LGLKFVAGEPSNENEAPKSFPEFSRQKMRQMAQNHFHQSYLGTFSTGTNLYGRLISGGGTTETASPRDQKMVEGGPHNFRKLFIPMKKVRVEGSRPNRHHRH